MHWDHARTNGRCHNPINLVSALACAKWKRAKTTWHATKTSPEPSKAYVLEGCREARADKFPRGSRTPRKSRSHGPRGTNAPSWFMRRHDRRRSWKLLDSSRFSAIAWQTLCAVASSHSFWMCKRASLTGMKRILRCVFSGIRGQTAFLMKAAINGISMMINSCKRSAKWHSWACNHRAVGVGSKFMRNLMPCKSQMCTVFSTPCGKLSMA
mmetsp:Transcript_103512/g.299502  ORF Transcript_103512/g.299502 Transcript_103512/m.299502 type:complete len:211 (-) Transcript_103512:953-1585(-)